MSTTVSLQFDGAGDLALDADGHPVYDRAPTGDIALAMRVPLGTFHADPDLGSLVPGMTQGSTRTNDEIRNAIDDGLARLAEAGVLVVDDILVFSNPSRALVYTSATDQPFKVTL